MKEEGGTDLCEVELQIPYIQGRRRSLGYKTLEEHKPNWYVIPTETRSRSTSWQWARNIRSQLARPGYQRFLMLSRLAQIIYDYIVRPRKTSLHSNCSSSGFLSDLEKLTCSTYMSSSPFIFWKPASGLVLEILESSNWKRFTKHSRWSQKLDGHSN